MKFVKSLIAPTLVAMGLLSAGHVAAQEKLTVWWVKGFYKAEDDALFAAIKKFEEKNKNVKIELSQYPIQDMIPKTVSALDSGSPPTWRTPTSTTSRSRASGPTTASSRTSAAC